MVRLCAKKIKGERHAKQAIAYRVIFSFLFNLTSEIIAPTKLVYSPSYLKALSSVMLSAYTPTRDEFHLHPWKLPSFKGFDAIALEGNSFI